MRVLAAIVVVNASFTRGYVTDGEDHPLVWIHCVSKGRVFYSAIGHPAAAARRN